jgi:hypothetical protein
MHLRFNPRGNVRQWIDKQGARTGHTLAKKELIINN